MRVYFKTHLTPNLLQYKYRQRESIRDIVMRKGMNTMKEQMINTKEIMEERELRQLCFQHDFIKAEKMAALAMEKYPDAAQPHNLYGAILEMTDQHVSAMKHFRAALALDPTYEPASYNLEQYGTLTLEGKHCAFDEEELETKKRPSHGPAKKQAGNSTLRMILYPLYRNRDSNVSKNVG